MNKRFVLYFLIAIVVSAITFSALYIKRSLSTTKNISPSIAQEEQIITPQETIMVTGTTSGEVEPVLVIGTTTEPTPKKELPVTSKPPQTQASVTQKIADVISTMTYTISSLFVQERGDTNESTITPTSYVPNAVNTETPYTQLPPQDFAGQKYIVVDGNIVTADNKVIYNIPPEVYGSASGGSDWTNTVVSVTAVGVVPPVVGAIPVENLPGKFYLSTNSFGDMEQCQFSNKIFILDTIANTTTLIYEENSSTLTKDDPRACNSEIFLLATDKEKLVLKYHTIGTNTLCDSAWSEPEKTFYIDVTKLQTEGMRKYVIPLSLSNNAEQEEEACRNLLSATGTQP
ncbi:MAG: hypothetical protein QG653_194 [Patescibacteria group bacterium]|nr:hypothetical protein [Patescibacteria group bacterium]